MVNRAWNSGGVGPKGNLTGRGITQPVRTQCKLCRHAIIAEQPAVWSTSPMGLVHEECPDP